MRTHIAPLAITLIAAVLAASCARSVALGPEEAVEVMVLDGVGRGQAECIVSLLDGQLDLAKITGLEPDLEDEELALLASTSNRCAPVVAGTSGVVSNGQTLDETFVAEHDALTDGEVDVDAAVIDLVAGGLEADIGDCLAVELALVPDAAAVLGDIVELSRLISECRVVVEAAETALASE